MMEVRNSNWSTTSYENCLRNSVRIPSSSKISMEVCFIWFNALIFITEFITDICLVIYYLHRNEIQWGLITLVIIVVPLMMCQLYSLILLRSQRNIRFSILIFHLLLMAIPYRYHSILKLVDNDEMSNQELKNIDQMMHDIKTLQIFNATFQYFPQFIFQVFLIMYKNYKCIITGVSAGLAGFSFIWHNFIHLYYYIRKIDIETTEVSTDDNLPSSVTTTSFVQRNATNHSYENTKNSYRSSDLSENVKIFEKPTYNTSEKNLVTEKQLKSVEKSNIFNFNKRKAVYENELNITDIASNKSTIFYEINESHNNDGTPTIISSPIKLSSLITTTKCHDFNNENNHNLSIMMKKYRQLNHFDYDINNLKNSTNIDDSLKNSSVDSLSENQILKRRGICSSQEMLHLVNAVSDIPPEEVDMLARSLIEMGGEESLINEISDNSNNLKLLENFPEYLDEKIIENIDAVIYENQVIFQERIRKNQLTIQNLKLQDQLLSKYIEEIKNLPTTELINIRDYENMCFANVSRTNHLKHWRNYLQDINTNLHDNSTVQNSSFYVNTLSNSLTDLYIESAEIGSAVIDGSKISSSDHSLSLLSPASLDRVGDNGTTATVECTKKCVRWSEKLTTQQQDNEPISMNSMSDFYTNLNGSPMYSPRKNILVETINAINDVELPIVSNHSCKRKVVE